jgi:hypothetical protein
MADLADRIRIRLVPALLTALGVAALAGGALSLTAPVAADPLPSPSPTLAASVEPSGTALITFPPLPSAAPPSTSPTPPADRVATRVRVAALGIDLPVVKPPGGADAYPYCDVAMYQPYSYPEQHLELRQPGQGGATYLFAHAQHRMFLPILNASKVQDGRSMLGMVVEVWTSDNQRFLYEITQVRRHVDPETSVNGVPISLLEALTAQDEQLWLQTSEGVHVEDGPRKPVLQVVALPISQEVADPADAHPQAKPRNCEPD